jgi:hypothetical protein
MEGHPFSEIILAALFFPGNNIPISKLKGKQQTQASPFM